MSIFSTAKVSQRFSRWWSQVKASKWCKRLVLQMLGTSSTRPTSLRTNLKGIWQHRSNNCSKTMVNTRVRILTPRSVLSAIEVGTPLMNKLPMMSAALMPTTLLQRSDSGSSLLGKWVRATVCRLQSIPQLRRMRCPTSGAPLNPSAQSTEWSALMLTPNICSRQHLGTAGLCEAELPSLPLFICHGGEHNFPWSRAPRPLESSCAQAPYRYTFNHRKGWWNVKHDYMQEY